MVWGENVVSDEEVISTNEKYKEANKHVVGMINDGGNFMDFMKFMKFCK